MRAPRGRLERLLTFQRNGLLPVFESRFRDSVRIRFWPQSSSCRTRKIGLETAREAAQFPVRLSRSTKSRRREQEYPCRGCLESAIRIHRRACGKRRRAYASLQNSAESLCTPMNSNGGFKIGRAHV